MNEARTGFAALANGGRLAYRVSGARTAPSLLQRMASPASAAWAMAPEWKAPKIALKISRIASARAIERASAPRNLARKDRLMASS